MPKNLHRGRALSEEHAVWHWPVGICALLALMIGAWQAASAATSEPGAAPARTVAAAAPAASALDAAVDSGAMDPGAVDFGQELEAFLRVAAVAGRERPASEFLA